MRGQCNLEYFGIVIMYGSPEYDTEKQSISEAKDNAMLVNSVSELQLICFCFILLAASDEIENTV